MNNDPPYNDPNIPSISSSSSSSTRPYETPTSYESESNVTINDPTMHIRTSMGEYPSTHSRSHGHSHSHSHNHGHHHGQSPYANQTSSRDNLQVTIQVPVQSNPTGGGNASGNANSTTNERGGYIITSEHLHSHPHSHPLPRSHGHSHSQVTPPSQLHNVITNSTGTGGTGGTIGTASSGPMMTGPASNNYSPYASSSSSMIHSTLPRCIGVGSNMGQGMGIENTTTLEETNIMQNQNPNRPPIHLSSISGQGQGHGKPNIGGPQVHSPGFAESILNAAARQQQLQQQQQQQRPVPQSLSTPSGICNNAQMLNVPPQRQIQGQSQNQGQLPQNQQQHQGQVQGQQGQCPPTLASFISSQQAMSQGNQVGMQHPLPTFRSHSLINQPSQMMRSLTTSNIDNRNIMNQPVNSENDGIKNLNRSSSTSHPMGISGLAIAHQALPLQQMPHQAPSSGMRPYARLPQLSSTESRMPNNNQAGLNLPSGRQKSHVNHPDHAGGTISAQSTGQNGPMPNSFISSVAPGVTSGFPQSSTATLGTNPRPRELKVEDALLYLDQVKQQFGNQPDIYNQFLEVMKSFKSQTIDTPGVIQRVSTLFHGYPKLILGFNTFLPPGYKIRPDSTLVYPSGLEAKIGQGMGSMSALSAAPALQSIKQQSGASIDLPSGSLKSEGALLPMAGHDANLPLSSFRASPSNPPYVMTGANGAPVKREPNYDTQGQIISDPLTRELSARDYNVTATSTPVEFDHAINYVTTIKQRFRDQPETYKGFLEILHTYQKEQRTIKEVLDQVSELFRDHPDLLREFTFFLPDSVQEQAKDRLNRAADKAILRRQQLAQQQGIEFDEHDHGIGGRKDNLIKAKRSYTTAVGARHRRQLAQQQEGLGEDLIEDAVQLPIYDRRREKEKDILRNKQVYQKQKLKRRTRTALGLGASLNGLKGGERNERNMSTRGISNNGNTLEERVLRREILAVNETCITKDEYEVFEKIRKILPSRDTWREFLKCLEVYSQDLLTYNEMLALVKDMFGRHNEVLDDLKKLLAVYGHRADTSGNSVWPYLPLAETDLSQSRRCTPSYRALPSNYPLVSCTMRTALENSICNDEWVSVPTGSEDFSFKLMRKNQYEEALFKCEDERFELDMILDANALTIYTLEPLLHEIEVLQSSADNSDELLYNYTLPKGLLRIIHCNAITRVYGEQGNQMLELLSKYPAGTIPVILGRLKSKQEEWKKVKYELNEKYWKEINEKNYYKSLDHSSFYFKQQDKKRIGLKRLVEEAKEAITKRKGNIKEHVDIKGNSELRVEGVSISNREGKEKEHKEEETMDGDDSNNGVFTYTMDSMTIHRDIYNLLSYVSEKNLKNDKEKLISTYIKLWLPFFYLTEDWIHNSHSREKKEVVRIDRPETEPKGTQTKEESTAKLEVITTKKECEDRDDCPDYIPKESTATSSIQLDYVLYGTETMYGFIRLYQLLYQRLRDAKELCIKAKYKRDLSVMNPAMEAFGIHQKDVVPSNANDEEETDKGDSKNNENALSEDKPKEEDKSSKDTIGELLHNDYYHTFISKLYAFLDGSIDSSRYEDYCRSIMGSRSYFLFTLDKVVNHMMKHLQAMASDEKIPDVCDLFREYNGLIPAADVKDDKMDELEKHPNAVHDEGHMSDEKKFEYLSKIDSIYDGEEDFYELNYRVGILKERPNTPIENIVSMPHVRTPIKEKDKIWAPSPRVRMSAASLWKVKPKLLITYVGFLEDKDKFTSPENEGIDEDMEDDDDGNSTSASIGALSPTCDSSNSPMMDASSEKSEGEFCDEEGEMGEDDIEIEDNDNEQTEDEIHSMKDEDEEETTIDEQEREEDEESNEIRREKDYVTEEEIKEDAEENDNETIEDHELKKRPTNERTDDNKRMKSEGVVGSRQIEESILDEETRIMAAAIKEINESKSEKKK